MCEAPSHDKQNATDQSIMLTQLIGLSMPNFSMSSPYMSIWQA